MKLHTSVAGAELLRPMKSSTLMEIPSSKALLRAWPLRMAWTVIDILAMCCCAVVEGVVVRTVLRLRSHDHLSSRRALGGLLASTTQR